MFLKSLQVLTGAGLLTLAAVVAYAALNLSRPEDALDRAEAMIQHNEFAAAVSELNTAERARSVQRDPAQRERLLRLRQRAHAELGNAPGALRDVEALLRGSVADVEALQLERIRLRAVAGDGDGALLAAEQFLTEHPQHGRGLELAGEACQTAYQPLLRELNERLARDLPSRLRQPARTALWSYVYRPDGDPAIESARTELAEHYASEPRLATTWPALATDLATLRRKVQTGLTYFQDSLAADGSPVAAFRAVALALEQAGRIDDLLVACEIHRRRFTHAYVDEAGAASAWVQLREGAYAATLATADRWLPPGTVQKRVDAGEVTGTLDLLLARTQAAWLAQDRNLLGRVWPDVGILYRNKVPGATVAHLTSAYQNWYDQKYVEAESTLRYAADLIGRTPLAVGRYDLLPGVVTLWLDLLQRRRAAESDVEAALQVWRRARPATIEPLLRQAEILRTDGRGSAALALLNQARALAPEDQDLFAQRLAVMRMVAPEQGQDGPTLLAQCLRQEKDVPEVRDPLGYHLCGEAALAQGKWRIATACDGLAAYRAIFLPDAERVEAFAETTPGARAQ